VVVSRFDMKNHIYRMPNTYKARFIVRSKEMEVVIQSGEELI